MITNLTLSDIFSKFNSIFTDYITVVLLIFCGIFFTFKSRFVQVRCFFEGVRSIFPKNHPKTKNNRGVSPFAALATAVGSQVGTGNIVGVAAAILIGGAGSVFWMWVSAFFGMATIYAEAVAAQITRKKSENGTLVGGPVHYISAAFSSPFGKILCSTFALSATVAFGFVGSMVQSNAVGGILFESFGISKCITGIILASLSFCAFSGGVTRISSISEKIVTLMAVIFMAVCIFVLMKNFALLPKAFALIFRSAFGIESAAGGFVGAALKKTIAEGTKKGLFSNEAGMGTTPHIHAVAEAESPHAEGVVAMLGVFIDSFVILTLTALVMICGLLNVGTAGAEDVNMNNLMLISLSQTIGELPAKIIECIALLLFGFSSIISWNYFGRVNFLYLFGKKINLYYSLFSAAFVFLGCLCNGEFVWAIADINNIFLVLPNVISLLKSYKNVFSKANLGTIDKFRQL